MSMARRLDANLRIDREDGSLWNPTAGVAGLKVYIPHKHKMGTIVEANKGWYSVKIDDEDEPKKMRKASLHFGVDDLPSSGQRVIIPAHATSKDDKRHYGVMSLKTKNSKHEIYVWNEQSKSYIDSEYFTASQFRIIKGKPLVSIDERRAAAARKAATYRASLPKRPPQKMPKMQQPQSPRRRGAHPEKP